MEAAKSELVYRKASLGAGSPSCLLGAHVAAGNLSLLFLRALKKYKVLSLYVTYEGRVMGVTLVGLSSQ